MERTGIGDAELARRIPVSRPTLIRWKEGVTTRPRYREDVARCAQLLRLAPEERDAFLAAAGFQPDIQQEPQTPDEPEEPAAESLPEPQPPVSVSRSRARRQKLWVGLGAAAFALIAVAAIAITFALFDRTVYPAASEGESLLLLAPFVNYTAGQQGFNVMGRLKEEIEREIAAAGIQDVNVAEWPKKIHRESDAQDAGRRSDAMLVIWGEYDSGRVIARFTVPDSRPEQREQQVVDIASTPSELPATINVGLTEEARYVALLTLGQLRLDQGEHNLARAALIRAMAKPPADPSALTNLRFSLGLAYRGGEPPNLDRAIELFSWVISSDPESVEAYNSRALSYMDRGREGDTELAFADFANALEIEPERAATHLNRAVAYIERGQNDDLARAIADLDAALDLRPNYAAAYVNRSGAYLARAERGDIERAFDDIEKALEIDAELASARVGLGNAYINRGLPGDMDWALAEFSRAIELSPKYARAYFNRGLVHSALQNLGSSLSDLRRAQRLKPANPIFSSALCWQMTAIGDPESALRFCDIADALDPSGIALDSRGFAHALMGELDRAAADFEAFLEWASASPKESCHAYYEPSRSAWVESLRAGRNPFDSMNLMELRVQPAPFREAPC